MLFDMAATLTPKELAILGKAGKYISIDRGPSAVSRPSNKIQDNAYGREEDVDGKADGALDMPTLSNKQTASVLIGTLAATVFLQN